MSDPVVAKNKVIAVTYRIYNQDGEVFEHSDIPVPYVHGCGSGIFEKVEQALLGKTVGDQVEVELSPEEGFGQPDPSLTFTDELANVPPELCRVGTELEAQNSQGEVMKFVVKAIDQDAGTLTVDGNHPLAGQTVKFIVTVADIRDASPEEIRSGQVNAPQTPLQ